MRSLYDVLFGGDIPLFVVPGTEDKELFDQFSWEEA